MNSISKMIQDAERRRPSKKSDLQSKLEELGWTFVANHCLINPVEPDFKPILQDDKTLFDYYHQVLDHGEVLVTEAHNRFGEPLGETYRAVYVKSKSC